MSEASEPATPIYLEKGSASIVVYSPELAARFVLAGWVVAEAAPAAPVAVQAGRGKGA